MILALLIFIVIAYITYLGIAKPSRISSVLAIFSLDAAMHTDMSKLTRLSEIADKYYQTKDLLAAEKAYLRVLKIDHQNFTAYYRLGLIYSYLNNNSDALECFELATRIKPTTTTLHNYGMTLFRYRDYEKAAEVLERANAKSPSFSRHITLARIYRTRDEYTKQLKHLISAVAIEKDNIDALTLLANAYLHHDNSAAATKVFRKILRLDPNNAQARKELANR